jgi:6-methylsalicylate decarboxylase
MSAPRHSRRDFVQTALTAGAGVLLSSIDAAGQPRTQARVDVHHHCRTPAQGAGRGPGADWSPQKSIEQMDKFGIATSLISATVPAEPLYDGTEKSRTVARSINDFIVKMMVDHPGRFGLFAAIPMPDIDGTLREIEYAFDTLHADGIGIFSSVRDKYPGDSVFTPIWQELNRRKAIVFIHPTFPACCGNIVPGGGVGSTARPERGLARRKASYRQQRERRAQCDRRWTGICRCDLRSSASRVRREDRQGALVHPVLRVG